MPANHQATLTAMAAACTAGSAIASPANAADSTRLVAGPANAIRKAALGVLASPLRVVTPPKSHNVKSPTLTPMRRATTACASSCANNDASNTSAPHTPASQYDRCEYPLTVPGSVLA